MVRIFDNNGNWVATVNGIYEYDSSAYYTEGDIVITMNNDFLVCIKDVPGPSAENFFDNPDYFRPFWYLYTIRDFNTYVTSVTPVDVERPVLKRVLEAALQRKFGTGLIFGDENLHDGELDLNNITHTGRYIVYLENIKSIKNLPAWIIGHNIENIGNSTTINIAKLVGLDVFSFSSINNNNQNTATLVKQVVFSNNNNKITFAVRSFNGSWSNWHVLRSSFDINAINYYLEAHRNIVESLYDATKKQAFGIKPEITKIGDDLHINIYGLYTEVIRQISGIMIFARDKLRDIFISECIPVATNTNSYKVKINRFTFDVDVSSTGKVIIIKNIYADLDNIKVLLIS